ncbi:hypothetical protein AVEN_266431-1 [Araneus ventricosus]|uniref:Uncharacterized protein n=1 Tax=Araneus ventricosus TaxID=182803 RepID=A0A4Y2LK10_ARAVE|nr:hypothetical protein AVEN_266431-1 [Araneus ventricosus]
MPRHCENTFRGTVKCRAISTTTAVIAVREVKPSEIGRERAMFREEGEKFAEVLLDAWGGGDAPAHLTFVTNLATKCRYSNFREYE